MGIFQSQKTRLEEIESWEMMNGLVRTWVLNSVDKQSDRDCRVEGVVNDTVDHLEKIVSANIEIGE